MDIASFLIDTYAYRSMKVLSALCLKYIPEFCVYLYFCVYTYLALSVDLFVPWKQEQRNVPDHRLEPEVSNGIC